jgi:hypothetical protein
MRGEISPMIAEASTSTHPKWASRGAKSAEFLPPPPVSGAKTAAAGQFLSRMGGQLLVGGSRSGSDKARRLEGLGGRQKRAVQGDGVSRYIRRNVGNNPHVNTAGKRRPKLSTDAMRHEANYPGRIAWSTRAWCSATDAATYLW